jgi:cell division transport system permease protein
MRLFRSDLPLAGDASARFLPWIIGCMVYLAALAVAAALSADNLAERWHAELAGRFTVELPPSPPSDEKEAKLRNITGFLSTIDGVTAVKLVGDSEKAALLQPWLGGIELPDDIALPDLIVVEAGKAVDLAKVSVDLVAIDPAIRVDDHANWNGDLLAFSNSMKILALIVLSLIALAAVSTVIFVTRTGLAIHRRVIEIVHLVGAQDSYIARQFLFHALRLGLAGGAVGAALAAATWLGLQRWLSGGGSGLLPSLALSTADWLAVAAVPVALAVVAMFTAQATVLILLGHEP